MRNKKIYLYMAIFFLNLLLFSIGQKPFKTVDTIGTRLIPVSIINEFNLDLDEFFGPPEKYLFESSFNPYKFDLGYYQETADDGRVYFHPWYITIQKGKFYTSYPIVFPILNLPFYLIAKLLNVNFQITLFELGKINSWINQLDNFIASFWTALGGLLLFIILERQNGYKHALIINLIYCLATPAFSLLSHNTWQHTLLVTCIFFILLLIKSNIKKHHYILGILLGLLPFIRPTGIFFYPLIFLVKKKFWKEWFIGALIPFILFLGLHLYIYSHPLGGYYYIYKMMSKELNQISISNNIMGLLFSPSRGLFTFMPFLLLVFPLIFYLAVKKKELRFEIFVLSIPFFLHLYYYSTSWSNWYGGLSYGPRFLSDNLPIYMLFLSIVLQNFNQIRIFNLILGVLVFFSFLIHLQPNISDKFLQWDVCYIHPKGFNEKVKNWTNPIFLKFIKDHRLLWKNELYLDYNDLCFSHNSVNLDGSINFSISDLEKFQMKLLNYDIKAQNFYYVYMKDIYLPYGNYELEMKDSMPQLFFSIFSKGMNFEQNFKNGKITFSVQRSDYYSFLITSKEPIEFTFYYIRIKKIN